MTTTRSLTANTKNRREQLWDQGQEKIICQAWTEMKHKAGKETSKARDYGTKGSKTVLRADRVLGRESSLWLAAEGNLDCKPETVTSSSRKAQGLTIVLASRDIENKDT